MFASPDLMLSRLAAEPATTPLRRDVVQRIFRSSSMMNGEFEALSDHCIIPMRVNISPQPNKYNVILLFILGFSSLFFSSGCVSLADI